MTVHENHHTATRTSSPAVPTLPPVADVRHPPGNETTRPGQVDPGPELMTPQEVCAFLRVTKDWLYDQVEARRIPHIRLGRNLRFRRTELENYLDARTVRPGTPGTEPQKQTASH